VLPLAEQLIRFRIGIGEVLAFHSAVFEKADVEKILFDAAAYRIAQDISDYRQLGGLRQELNKATQQICILKQAALMSLIAEHGYKRRPNTEHGPISATV
jgi:hypothetical protein